jgi:thioredoxin 1
VVGVLVAKSAGKKSAAGPPAGSGTGAAVAETGTVAAAPAVVAQGEALPRLVDIGAKKCIPCKMMAPILEELKATFAGKMDVQFIDISENPDAGEKYGVNIIPTQIFFDAQGKERFRHEGFFGREDILAKWKEFGVELPVAKEAVSR